MKRDDEIESTYVPDWKIANVKGVEASPCMNINVGGCDRYMVRHLTSSGDSGIEISMPIGVASEYSREFYGLEAVNTGSHSLCNTCYDDLA